MFPADVRAVEITATAAGARWADGSLDAPAPAGGTWKAQLERALANLTAALARLHAAPSDVARIDVRFVGGRFEQVFQINDLLVIPIRDEILGSFNRTGLILLGGAVLVLVVACASMVSLASARAAERSTEVAVRAALGAGRSRIVRELLSESLLLSAVGGMFGLLAAAAAVGPLTHMIPSDAGVPFLDRVSVDWRVVAFAFAVAAVCGAACGSRTEPPRAVSSGGGQRAPA